MAEAKENDAIPSSARVWESAVIAKDKDSVWEAVKSCTFKFNPKVKKADVKGDGMAVGSTREITYADGTVQTLQIVELSDLSKSITWILIASEPAYVPFVFSLPHFLLFPSVPSLCCKQLHYTSSCNANLFRSCLPNL